MLHGKRQGRNNLLRKRAILSHLHHTISSQRKMTDNHSYKYDVSVPGTLIAGCILYHADVFIDLPRRC